MREGIRERRIRKRGGDLEKGLLFGKTLGEGGREKGGDWKEKFLWGFLLGKWCCWDFGLEGQEI
jgi:hypothetical protein